VEYGSKFTEASRGFPFYSTDLVLMCLATLAQYASVTNRQAELLYQYV